MVTQTFYVHVVPDAICPTIYLEQLDYNLVQLVFNLVETSGYYTIPSGTTATVVGAKPDGKAFSYACTWSGHTVSLTVTDQMTAVPGKVFAQLRLQNSAGTANVSIPLRMIINRSPLDGMLCSKNDFVSVERNLLSARSDAVAAQNYATQAQTSYNNTVSAGTTAVNNITSAKTSALNSITAAESSAVNLIDNHTTSGVSQVNSAKNDGVSTLNSLVNTATTTANNAVSQIEASEAAVQETMDTAIAELLSYADDPNKVIYEYTENNGNFRITALASQVTVQEPNSVTYEYDDSTDTITFTAD